MPISLSGITPGTPHPLFPLPTVLEELCAKLELYDTITTTTGWLGPTLNAGFKRPSQPAVLVMVPCDQTFQLYHVGEL